MKITDFGLSKLVNESTRNSTFKGFGCIQYLPPEGWNFNENTLQMDMTSKNLVILKGNKEIPFKTDVLKPNTNYRCIEIEEATTKQFMVYGIVFDEKTFNKMFKYLHQQVISEWVTLGLIKNNKPISKTAFKELASVHQYGKRNNNLRIIYFYSNPKELLYAFYPPIKDTKARDLDYAYRMYLNVMTGCVDYIDSEDIQRGNSGIPISYGDIKWRNL